MLNMNSPVVQNMMQQSGFNPYVNNGYVPQQPVYYGYNPYAVPQPQTQQPVETYYDTMPNVIVNENRGIHSSIQSCPNYGYQQPITNNGFYNNQLFNGYVNPYLMKNQMEAQKLQQREMAIQQGKVWRKLFSGYEQENEYFNMDDTIRSIELMYCPEINQEEIPLKTKIIIEDNNHIARLNASLNYCKQNNIPIRDSMSDMRDNFNRVHNHIREIVGDGDLVDYFTRAFPILKQEDMDLELRRQQRNRKTNYNSNQFNELLDRETKDKSDSYYYKLMDSIADHGLKLSNGDGLTITADEMEIKLPDRLMKSRQEKYYEQRRKFYESVFKKEI